MTQKFRANGKLMLTGEYVVLNQAISLALPTKRGQTLLVTEFNESFILWESYTYKNELWFLAKINCSDFSIIETNNKSVAQQLILFFEFIKSKNTSCFTKGLHFKTKLEFNREWGLGSSSTLISCLAEWGNVNPYELLFNTFKGSGYDIACAKENTALLYQLIEQNPMVENVSFNPDFKDDLYFIYLNQKQNSREGIKKYRSVKHNLKAEISQINAISKQILKINSLNEFEDLLFLHEYIIGDILNESPIKSKLFNDYNGCIKSLGAWGGDFILATNHGDLKDYFNAKGFHTIIPFKEMIL